MASSIWVPRGVELDPPSHAAFYTFILKVASQCNLACTYCYVYEGADQSWRDRPQFMSEATAEQTFRRINEHVREKNIESIVLTFHGGEPLLAGVKRLRSYLEAANDLISADIQFSIQTNGTLITDEVLELFAEYDVKVGLSLDGNRSSNDRFRRYRNGTSSFDGVISAIELIKSRERWSRLLTGFLAVIDLGNDPKELLRFMSKHGRGFDVLLPDCNHDHLPWRPPEDEKTKISYGKWLADLFDAWLHHERDLEIGYIEEIIAMLLGQSSAKEHIGSQFADLIIIESDGDIEGVDTLKMVGRHATKLGLNVHRDTFSEALAQESIACRLVGYNALCDECRSCSILEQCGGGYLPHRYKGATGFLNPSVYCNDIQYLVSHIKKALHKELVPNAGMGKS